MTNPATAAGAYASLSRLMGGAGGLVKPLGGGSGGGPDFGDMVKKAMGAVVEAGHKSDSQAEAMAAGKANVVDVVTAVAETEVAVDALVSVRDRVIRSYEDILKMPI